MSADTAVAWLREQVQARLEVAKAAPGTEWRAFREADIAGASVYDEQWLLLSPARYDHSNALSNKPGATGPQYIQRHRDDLAAHIALNDPQDVIARCEAELGTIGLCERVIREDEARHEDCGGADTWTGLAVARLNLGFVASGYQHREGYAEHWGSA